jgi:Lrp/AsnC family leucine-responsive transcriptional regulator
MDPKDREIVAILQENAVTSKAELARRVGLTPTAVFERVRKLEEREIRGYAVRLDPAALGLPLLAFVHVIEDEGAAGDTAGHLAGIRGVEEVHRIAGEDGFLVKVRARDTTALLELLDAEFRSLESIRSLRTSIVLETVAEGQSLPLDRLADPSSVADHPNLLTLVQGRESGWPPRRGRRTP